MLDWPEVGGAVLEIREVEVDAPDGRVGEGLVGDGVRVAPGRAGRRKVGVVLDVGGEVGAVAAGTLGGRATRSWLLRCWGRTGRGRQRGSGGGSSGRGAIGDARRGLKTRRGRRHRRGLRRVGIGPACLRMTLAGASDDLFEKTELCAF